jgi:hypothetical protein
MAGPEVRMTLEEAVAEVLGLLTGLDLSYAPELERFRSVARSLNRSLRANALENEWSCYHSTTDAGASASCGATSVRLPASLRPRVLNDDAVRLVDTDGNTRTWAYFLPRDALHKYRHMVGLWVSSIEGGLLFSRPFTDAEEGLEVHVPVMREPVMFRLPAVGQSVPDHIRLQEVDFAYPDLVIARAAYFYAQTDPVMQPRVPTLEGDYKTLMYQLIERDTSHTEAPYSNSFTLPLENGLVNQDTGHLHPHADFI